ncbi:glycosyltransferase family 4 protein [Microbacterium sp. NPDC019599]|uniref:glycosyltransferase family 4 protein n=1 Tax=Microbacterium sp. NPDC019599 TaxID=3154690 RepID=UPI00340B0B87
MTADYSLVLMRGLPAFLVDQGWDVHVITSPGPQLEELRSASGVTTHSIPMRRDPSPVQDLLALLIWMREVRSVRPDVLWAGTPKAALLAMIAGWTLRIPERIYVVRGLRLETASGALRMLLARLEKITFALSTRALVVSPSLRAELVRLNLTDANKLIVLGHGSSNGVDTSRFYSRLPGDKTVRALRRQVGLADGIPVVGFIGRLTPDKGLAMLKSAIGRLVEKGVDFQLLVIGGPDGENSTDMAPLDDGRVFFTGHVRDTSAYYALIDVLCLPTRREGFPNVVLEAGASGVPTVTTTATGAVDSVLDRVTGRIVNKESDQELADALAELISDPLLRTTYGERAREWTVQNFAQEIVWEAIDGHLTEVWSSRSGGKRNWKNS